mgnify:FL=1
MKIRYGFVSNSSSSSFVVLGAHIPEKELKKMGWYDDEYGQTDEVPKGISIYYVEGKKGYIVGKPLCNSEESYGLDYAELSVVDDLIKMEIEMETLLKRPVKLIMGTRPT